MDMGESDDILKEEWVDYEDEMMHEMRKYDPPEVTLTALAEASQDESTIPVLKQQSYTGRKIISSVLADTSCAYLGVDGVFEMLNMILGTSYILSPTMSSLLESYIEKNYDFGTVYAHLRFYWFRSATIEESLRRDEENDRKRRREVIINDKITNRHMPPRRVWDLYANRVVPYWVALTGWYGISHAWVSDEERTDVMTPINGYEWPVPIPKDVNLNLIRIEMLNLGAQYAWLDVLCLRQEQEIREDHREEDQLKENLRKEEWKLDIPTIGYVYDEMRTVVCYLSGLGRPLSFKLVDFESDQCWFNRAWTLQEIPGSSEPLIGGDTGEDRFMEEEIQTRVHEQLRFLSRMRAAQVTFNILSQMRNRVSTKPLDKVAGLVYLFYTESIPIYDAAQSEEAAWAALVDVMSPSLRAELFFYYPEPGNRNKSWQPSWEQVMTKTLPWLDENTNIGGVCRTEDIDSDWYEGPRIDSIHLIGLAEASDQPRQGKFFCRWRGWEHDVLPDPQQIRDSDTRWWPRGYGVYKIVADHTYIIHDGWYTLIGIGGPYGRRGNIWVIGQQRHDGKFEKVSVIRLEKDELRILQKLHPMKRTKTVLC